MEQSKKLVARQGDVGSQQALVNRLLPQTIKPKKFIIPGGQNMLKTIDQQMMEQAVYNWLRGCRFFSEFTLSFAEDPSKYNTSTTKVYEFTSTGGPYEPWLTNREGKRWLARLVADQINDNKFLALKVTAEGIFLIKDVEGTFAPTRKATKEDVEADTTNELRVGDFIPHEDWCPYISFIPKGRSQYAV